MLVPSACLAGLRSLGACFGLSSSLGSFTGFVGCPVSMATSSRMCNRWYFGKCILSWRALSRMEDIDDIKRDVVECWLGCTSLRSPVARSRRVEFPFRHYFAWPVLPQPFRAMQMQSKLLIVMCTTRLPSSSLWYQNWAQIDKAYATPRLSCRELFIACHCLICSESGVSTSTDFGPSKILAVWRVFVYSTNLIHSSNHTVHRPRVPPFSFDSIRVDIREHFL
jgi:hypothetical protein